MEKHQQKLLSRFKLLLEAQGEVGRRSRADEDLSFRPIRGGQAASLGSRLVGFINQLISTQVPAYQGGASWRQSRRWGGFIMLLTAAISLPLTLTIPAFAASPTISLSQSTNTVNINVPAGGGIGVGGHTLTATVTGDTMGYNVTLSSNSDTTSDMVKQKLDSKGNVIGSDNTKTLKSIVGTNKALTNNTYGFTLRKASELTGSNGQVNSTASTAIWNEVPLSNKPVSIVPAGTTTTATTGTVTKDIDVAYGVNTDDTQYGKYQTEVKYTATATPKPEEAPEDLGGEVCESVSSAGFNTDDEQVTSNCQIDIDDNMIPVIYTGNETTPEWSAINPNDSYINVPAEEWYNYSKKQWANAVTLRNDKSHGSYSLTVSNGSIDDCERNALSVGASCSFTRHNDNSGDMTPAQAYEKMFSFPGTVNSYAPTIPGDCSVNDCSKRIVTLDGKEILSRAPINADDILGFWTYIPRYDYQVRTLSGADKTPTAKDFNIRFRKVGDSDAQWQKLTPSEAVGDSDTINNKAWATHPAFSWCKTVAADGTKSDCTELNGIWVGKFETTGSTAAPTILPNSKHIAGNTMSGGDFGIGAFYDVAKSLGAEDAEAGGGSIEVDTNTHSLAAAKTHMLKNSEWGCRCLSIC